MDSCDILIVGGGPAGSSCAQSLRDSGLNVVILDRSVFPRDKVCGGWITPQVVEELGLDLNSYRRGRILQPITSFIVGAIEGKAISVGFDSPVSYGIRRCEFDTYLLQRSGAELHQGVPIRSIERTRHGWLVNGEFHARMLVGAGGHFCPVARYLGNNPAALPVVAQEVEFRMSEEEIRGCSVRPEVPELYFCRDLVGYGWVFRKGDYLNIGLGRLDSRGLRSHMERFVGWLESQGRLRLQRKPTFHGHAYFLFGGSCRRLVDDGVLLIGDSAGLAYPQSGEGIRPAIESGMMAAEVLRQAAGDYSRSKLDIYAVRLIERFSTPATPLQKLGEKLPKQLRISIGRSLLRTERFGRMVVEDWFLHRKDPALRLSSTPALARPPAA